MNRLFPFALLACVMAPLGHAQAQTPAPDVTAQTPVPAQTITVIGAVDKPGNYAFIVGEKVTALLERGGGLKPVASPAGVYIIRNGVRILLDLTLDKERELTLREGDVLVVPENLRRIHVLGDVARPGSFALPENTPESKPTSVLDALEMAGGMLSAPGDVRIDILRRKPDVSVERHAWSETTDEGRFQLQDGDIIYVQRRRNSKALPDFTSPNFIWPIIPRRSATSNFQLITHQQ